MLRNWFVGIFIFVFIGLGATTLTYFYLINKNNEKNKEVFYLPQELTETFDPTINTPIFEIVSIDENKKTLGLVMIFPENYDPKEITSLISCQEQDIKILRNEKEVGEGLVSFFIEVKKGLGTPMTLSGLCSDQTCNEINKQCQLNLP